MIGKTPRAHQGSFRPTSSVLAHRQAVMFPVSGELLTVNLFGCKNGRPRRDARRIRLPEFGRSETAFGREIFPAALGNATLPIDKGRLPFGDKRLIFARPFEDHPGPRGRHVCLWELWEGVRRDGNGVGLSP